MRIIFALALVPSFVLMAPGLALAQEDWAVERESSEAQQLSWCHEGSVYKQDQNGRLIELVNCAKSGLRCAEETRIIGGGQRVVFAVCAK